MKFLQCVWVAVCFFLSIAFNLLGEDQPNLSNLLSGMEGVGLEKDENGNWVVRGDLQRLSDQKRLRNFLKHYPEVKDETGLAPEAELFVEKKLEKRLRLIAPEARLKREGEKFFIVGTDSAKALESLRTLYPEVYIQKSQSGLSGGIQPTIFLEVVLVEIRKSALRRLGPRLESPLGLSTNLGLQILQGNLMMSALRVDPIRAFLDAAIQQGEARVHAKQSVITQNGRTGRFQVGGEFPIKIVSGIIAKVEFKQFGLILQFTPHLAGRDQVHLEIDSEISDIDMGSMVDGIPVIIKKKLTTQIFAPLNQALAVAGIVEARNSKFVDKIPGLGGIPILGRLFQSEDFKRQRSEAYLFLTPKKMDRPWLPSPEL